MGINERIKSAAAFEQAQKVIPGGVNSPVRALKSVGTVQGQIKEAYMTAKRTKKLSAGMHKLFESALQIGKRVRSETQISHGAVSHSLAAIEIIEQEKIDLHNSRITIIGVNKLTEEIIKFLLNKKAKLVFLANRTEEKARRMAEPYGIDIFRLEDKQKLICGFILSGSPKAYQKK